MEPVPVSAVLLDVGGVLHLPDPLALGRLVGRPLTGADVAAAHYPAVAAMTTFAENDADVWRAYAATLASGLGVAEATDEIAALLATPGSWDYTVPEAGPFLRRLAATGVGLAIVSNSDGTLESRLRAELLCQVGDGDGVCVAVVCDSGACGVAKPDPRIFALALDALGVAPEAAVHVGDTYGSDVVGAQSAGVRALHLDPLRLCDLDDHDHATDLDAVAAYVEAASAPTRSPREQ